MSKIIFAATVKLPGTGITDDDLDCIVTADITPGDSGGRHCPPSGPIPEVERVEIDPHADVTGTRYARGEDVVLLLGEEDLFRLEDAAISAWIEEERGIMDQEPPEDRSDRDVEAEEEYLNHFKEE